MKRRNYNQKGICQAPMFDDCVWADLPAGSLKCRYFQGGSCTCTGALKEQENPLPLEDRVKKP